MTRGRHRHQPGPLRVEAKRDEPAAAEPARLPDISDSGNLPGNSDSCAAGSWTQKCDVRVDIHGATDRRPVRPADREGNGRNLLLLARAARRRPRRPRTNEISTSGGTAKRSSSRRSSTTAYAKAIERINVSPDGSNMAFITKTRLTAYDNAGYSEMYLYDPAARDDQVRFMPAGRQNRRSRTSSEARERALHELRRPDVLVDRRLADAAGREPEHRRLRVRRRPAAADHHRHRDDTGNEFQHPGLVGVSADGIDVFFATYRRRSSRRTKTASVLKFYDARTNGGFAPEPLNPPCQAADECHGEERCGCRRLRRSAPPHGWATAATATRRAKKKKHKKRKAKCRKQRRRRQDATQEEKAWLSARPTRRSRR